MYSGLPVIVTGVVATSYLVLWGLVERLPRVSTRTTRRWRRLLGADWAPAALGVLPEQWMRRIRQLGRMGDENQGVEELTTELAFSLRAGLGVVKALQSTVAGTTGRLREALEHALSLYDSGEPLETVLESFSRAVATRDTEFLRTVLLIGNRTGGDLPRMLTGCARILRERRVLQAELMLETAEARWSAALVAFTPMALLGFFMVFQPRFMEPLLHASWGRFALAYAVASWSLGVYLTWRLTRPAQVFLDQAGRGEDI